MNRADAQEVLDQPKFGDPPAAWSQKPSHANALVLAFGVTDSSGIALPGLTVDMEWQPPKRLRRETLLLSLQRKQSGITERVYQLELCAPDHPSHMELGTMQFGPHEHVGDSTTMLPGLSGTKFSAALQYFLERTNVSLEAAVAAPDDFTLT